nr:zinc finger, CCHC-type [Tanacetum cinerariifolium]
MGSLPGSACLGSLSLTQSLNSLVLRECLEIRDNHLWIDQEEVFVVRFFWKEQEGYILFGLPGSRQQKFLVSRFFDIKEQQGVDRRLEDKQPEEKTNTYYLRSTQQCMKSGVVKHLGVVVIQQQNGLVKETNVTLLAKYRSPSSAIRLKKPVDMLGSFGWLASIKQGILKPVKCFTGIWGFNESEEYKKTFIGSGVGTGSMQVLHGFKFEVKPLGDHTFEVEPQENVDQGAGLQEMCMCSATVAGNAVTTSMAITGGIHQATKGLLAKAKGNILSMKIVRDHSGNTLRVSQSRFYNGKLVQTLLEGHSILLLEGSLSGDCDVEKNGKWSCIYAIGSHEYQVVCTRPDIASTDVGMFDGFDRGLQTYVQDMKALSTTEAGYMTFTEAWKKKIWLKGRLTESRYELRLVAGIATGALVKGGSRSEVPAQVEVAAYRY